MKKKALSIIIMTLLSLSCFCAGLIAPILAKYAIEADAPFNGDVDLDYTVSDIFDVRNQEELFAAINHGYSYVRISSEVKNPLVVTMDAGSLHEDLILDLNGKEIQRNGHAPILDVGPGIRLTITDTSQAQTGGFYNPVGSVFIVDGGTLTVVAGDFESGPRYSEYISYNMDVLAQNANRTEIVMESPQIVAAKKVNYTQGAETAEINMPIIMPCDTAVGYNGNLYFDRTLGTQYGIGREITVDTYCYYHISSLDANISNKEAEATWYYTYYANPTNYEYISNVEPTEGDSVLVTVYGYEKTIETAASKTHINDYYAALKMRSGTLDVMKGGFYSYFGVPTTACVDAVSGNLTIKTGKFAARVPDDHKNAIDSFNSVSQRGDDTAAFEQEYFNVFRWQNEDDTDGAQARLGKSFCILNDGDATVTIEKGDFFASNNNIVCMSDIEGDGVEGKEGVLTIQGGEFIKRLVNNHVNHSEHYDFASAIYMTAGILNIDNALIKIKGDYVQGVRMVDGVLNLNNSTVDVKGDYAFGIYSTSENLNEDNDLGDHYKGRIHVRNTDFEMSDGVYQSGIYASKGTVHLLKDENATKTPTFNIKGNNAVGVYATHKGEIISDGYDYELEGVQSAGIYSAGGSVRMFGGRVRLLSNVSCYGVYVAPDGTASLENDTTSSPDTGENHLNLDGVMITVGYSKLLDLEGNEIGKNNKSVERTGEVVSSIGVFFTAVSANSKMTLNNSKIYCNEVGIALNKGHLKVTGGGTIKTEKASAIAISGGDLTFEDGQNVVYNVTSQNTRTADDVKSGNNKHTNLYNIKLPVLKETAEGKHVIDTVAYQNTDGIYLEGGSFACNGQLNLTHTGLQNITGYQYYDDSVITSYAVRVVGGSVTMLKGNITADIGGGIYCSSSNDKSGRITMGDENIKNATINVHTTGTKRTQTYYAPTESYDTNSWGMPHSITGGHAVELNGGNIEIYYGTFTAEFGNGIFAKSDGTIDVYDGTFYGWDTNLGNRSGPGAFYGLKVIGGATVNIHDGTFNGGNGGAFVTGIDEYNKHEDLNKRKDLEGKKRATVRVYKGVFGGPDTRDAFTIYDYSDVVLGAYGEEYTGNRNELITMQVNSTGHGGVCIAICTLMYGSASGKDSYAHKNTSVSIYYGHYPPINNNTIYTAGPYMWVKVYNIESFTTGMSSISNSGEHDRYVNSGTGYYQGT